MKKLLKIILPLLVLGLLVYFGFRTYSTIQHKNQIAERISKIPFFSLLTLDGNKFTETELSYNQNIIFLYFNSECDFCHEEAKEIFNSLTKFKDTQFIFISNESPEKIKDFGKQYKLIPNINIHFLYDSKSNFTTLFGVKSIPYFLVYNKQHQLVSTFKGFVKIENILKILP